MAELEMKVAVQYDPLPARVTLAGRLCVFSVNLLVLARRISANNRKRLPARNLQPLLVSFLMTHKALRAGAVPHTSKKGDTGGIPWNPSSPCLPVATCLYFNGSPSAHICTRNACIIPGKQEPCQAVAGNNLASAQQEDGRCRGAETSRTTTVR
jgi:hypothetical protein